MSETSNNQLLKITEIEGRGRALVASQTLKAGQILLRDSPILLYPAVALKNGDPSNFCFNCFRKLMLHDEAARSKVLKCPNCSYHALFCGPNCQSVALSTSHTPWVCQALNCIRYSRSLLDSDAQIQANFLISAYNLAVVSPSSFQLLLSLQGESPSTPNPQTLALHSFISSISPPQSLAGFGFSPELTAALLAKDKQNAFGLMDPFQENSDERSVRAYGIYPKASFFNHDCLPNACRFDYVDTIGDNNNTDIIIRAIHDIQEGREICLSYFPVNWNFKDRQRRLLDDYGFNCDCDRCKVEANWKDDDDDDDDNMESEGNDDEQMMAGGSDDQDEDLEGGGDDNEDFPHAYFFVKYVCERENCGGTLAPLPPSVEGTQSNVLECNVCGLLRTEEEEEEDGAMSD